MEKPKRITISIYREDHALIEQRVAKSESWPDVIRRLLIEAGWAKKTPGSGAPGGRRHVRPPAGPEAE